MEKLSKVIVFELNGQAYGTDIQQVRSIERMQEITAVPGTAEFIKGVSQIRGVTTPIMDLKERLNLPKNKTRETAEEKRILVISSGSVQMGFIVDAATDVIDIAHVSIEPVEKMAGIVLDAYLKGVAKLESGILILLDLGRVLDENEANELADAVK